MSGERHAAAGTSATREILGVLEVAERHAEDRPGGRPQGLRPRRVGAARERRTNAGPSASAARTSVPTFPGSETRQSASPTGASSSRGRSARRKTATDPGRVRQGREPAITSGATSSAPGSRSSSAGRSASDQRLDRLEAGVEPGRDEVLALAGEEPELLALTPRPELADELDPRVGRGRDHVEARARPRARPSPARRSSRTPRDRCTAMSASALRSSSISAFRQPATNWL